MAAPRLTSGLWVSAYMARLRFENMTYYLVSRGDETAGSVLVKIVKGVGQACVYERGYDYETDLPAWYLSCEGTENDVDHIISCQCQRDRDLWVIEVEDRLGDACLTKMD